MKKFNCLVILASISFNVFGQSLPLELIINPSYQSSTKSLGCEPFTVSICISDIKISTLHEVDIVSMKYTVSSMNIDSIRMYIKSTNIKRSLSFDYQKFSKLSSEGIIQFTRKKGRNLVQINVDLVQGRANLPINLGISCIIDSKGNVQPLKTMAYNYLVNTN